MSSRVPGVKSCSPKRCSGMLIGASHPYDGRAHHPFTLTRLKSNLQHHCCCRAVCYLTFSPVLSLLVITVVVTVSNRIVIFFLYLRNTVFLSNLKKQRHRKQVSVGLHKELLFPHSGVKMMNKSSLHIIIQILFWKWRHGELISNFLFFQVHSLFSKNYKNLLRK